nr:Aquaporin [Hymenolepis microstoma]
MKAYPHYTEFWKIFQIFIAEVWAAGVSHYPSFLFDTREPNLPIVAGAIAGAAYYVALWYSFPVSGAQVSPTFTLAALITRRLPLYLAPVYIIADFLGALLAISISWSVTPYADQAPGTYGMTLPGKGISNVAATMTEAGSTFILISVGLASLDELRDREWRPEYGSPFPLAIMLTIMVNVATTIHISGASMNPTRSLAAAIIQNNYDRLWIYFAGPFLGTVVACFFYELVICPKASLRRTQYFLCSSRFDRHNSYQNIHSEL